MKRCPGLSFPSFAARKAALLLCGVALFTAMGGLWAPPAQAACAYVEGGRAFFVPGGAQQATIHAGRGAGFEVVVRLSDGTTQIVTVFASFASGGQGFFFEPGAYISVPADANKQFPLYAIYQDPCTGTFHTFTVSLHVIP